MSYFQTDDIPTSSPGKIKPHLRLSNASGKVIIPNSKSFRLREYYKNNYAPAGSNGKRVWRAELIKLGYKIENVAP